MAYVPIYFPHGYFDDTYFVQDYWPTYLIENANVSVLGNLLHAYISNVEVEADAGAEQIPDGMNGMYSRVGNVDVHANANVITVGVDASLASGVVEIGIGAVTVTPTGVTMHIYVGNVNVGAGVKVSDRPKTAGSTPYYYSINDIFSKVGVDGVTARMFSGEVHVNIETDEEVIDAIIAVLSALSKDGDKNAKIALDAINDMRSKQTDESDDEEAIIAIANLIA